MEELRFQRMNRRELQRLLLLSPAPFAALLASGHVTGIALAQDSAATPESGEGILLAPTPSCDEGDLDALVEQTEGPYFTPDSPERTSLIENGMQGRELVVTGFVYTQSCSPVAGALLDFWQCDDAGVYDNQGYRLRGHQFTDETGRYELTTIMPGLYPGRTRHIHLKVQAPNGPVLTSQLYFPDEPENERDGIFDERLVVDLEKEETRDAAFYTFVVSNQ